MKKSFIIIASILALCLLIVAAVIFFSDNDDASLASTPPVPTVPTLSNEPPQSSETVNSGMPEQTTEAIISPSPSAEMPVLVNEQDDEKGLIYLGLPYDEIVEILDENRIGHDKMEDVGSYVISFIWNDGDFMIFFDVENDVVDCIQVAGPTPVRATATQKGLNLGDTYEKMVELYGDDYTTHTVEFIDEIYTLYDYDFGDHYFEVWLKSDKVTSWRIG